MKTKKLRALFVVLAKGKVKYFFLLIHSWSYEKQIALLDIQDM